MVKWNSFRKLGKLGFHRITSFFTYFVELPRFLFYFFFTYLPEYRFWHSMQIFSIGDIA